MCLFCSNPLNKSGKKYCSIPCQQAFQRNNTISSWLSGVFCGYQPSWGGISKVVRDYIFSSRGRKCERCGWAEKHPVTGEVPVQIDHIDGDWKNCRPENLRILCPNCHSLTPTFGGRNRGRGRPQRYTRQRST